MLLVTNVDVTDVLPEVEWPTLVFFMGLFAMVAGLVHTGVIGALGSVAESAFGDNWFGAATALLFGSAVLGAFVDNIPYTATMTPVVEGMAAQAADAETGQGAVVGVRARRLLQRQRHRRSRPAPTSSPLGIAHRAGHPISFWRFTRYGIVVTLLSTTLAWVYVWLRYF